MAKRPVCTSANTSAQTKARDQHGEAHQLILRLRSYLQLLVLSLQVFQDDLQFLLIFALAFTLGRIFLGFASAMLLATERPMTNSDLNASFKAARTAAAYKS